MAGGKGKRLMPHTNTIPKPLMPINNKSMIEHVIDRFKFFGSRLFFYNNKLQKRIVKSIFSLTDKKTKTKLIIEKLP